MGYVPPPKVNRAAPILLLAAKAEIPEARQSIEAVRAAEADQFERQLAALPANFRGKLEANLGISRLAVFPGRPSELGMRAARKALEAAQVEPKQLDLIVDFSTLPGDRPGLWSLANHLQAELGADQAAGFSVHGGGCAGLHVALSAACAFLKARERPSLALLVAADCAGNYGRASLPISVMGDGAAALVVGTKHFSRPAAPRIAAIQTATLGALQDIVTLRGVPPRIEVDGMGFIKSVLPIHFIMTSRVLQRALAQANCKIQDLDWVSYPNTTLLDRSSVARALGIELTQLSGPGPAELGHAFASDLIINCPQPLFSADRTGVHYAALVAVGSGFTWGACILESNPD